MRELRDQPSGPDRPTWDETTLILAARQRGKSLVGKRLQPAGGWRPAGSNRLANARPPSLQFVTIWCGFPHMPVRVQITGDSDPEDWTATRSKKNRFATADSLIADLRLTEDCRIQDCWLFADCGSRIGADWEHLSHRVGSSIRQSSNPQSPNNPQSQVVNRHSIHNPQSTNPKCSDSEFADRGLRRLDRLTS